jgi:NADH pyrophosphatase NudC (nudix superfamily)
MNCDHILGVSRQSITSRETEEVLAVWYTEITASRAGYCNGEVSLWWKGSRYNYCPKCGEKLEPIYVGLYRKKENELHDIIRIEKAPKPVMSEILITSNNHKDWAVVTGYIDVAHAIKLTIINGEIDKWEKVK